MAVPKVKIRPRVTVTQRVHPVYAAHLEALERMGIDLERVITIATNAVHNVGTVIPPEKPESIHEHWVAGHCAASVQLVPVRSAAGNHGRADTASTAVPWICIPKRRPG